VCTGKNYEQRKKERNNMMVKSPNQQGHADQKKHVDQESDGSTSSVEESSQQTKNNLLSLYSGTTDPNVTRVGIPRPVDVLLGRGKP
jgi:hypothetical protein